MNRPSATLRLLIRQENSDIAFPPISAKSAEMDGAPTQYLVAGSIAKGRDGALQNDAEALRAVVKLELRGGGGALALVVDACVKGKAATGIGEAIRAVGFNFDGGAAQNLPGRDNAADNHRAASEN